MSKVSQICVYHKQADIPLLLRNEACPIWIEGTLSPTSLSILEFTTPLSLQAWLMLNSLQLDLAERQTESPGQGLIYKLSISDVEKIKTWCQNYFLPPWQEAKLRVDENANDVKALLLWIAYWVDFTVNLELEPYLYIEIGPF